MYEGREVYTSAPLALVAAEVRFSYAPQLRQAQAMDHLVPALADALPVVKTFQQTSLTLSSQGVSQSQGESAVRILNKPSTISLLITPTALTLETTDYDEFGPFHDLLVRACEVMASVPINPALERIGLRYIDEIRVPTEIKDARDWRGWVADPLVDFLGVASQATADSGQGFAEYRLGDHQSLTFRFAALHGPGVVGNDPLQRPTVPQPGPFFVLDVDSYHQRPSGDPADFHPGWVSGILTDLHDPAGQTFQNAITNRSRAIFREQP